MVGDADDESDIDTAAADCTEEGGDVDGAAHGQQELLLTFVLVLLVQSSDSQSSSSLLLLQDRVIAEKASANGNGSR